MVIQRSSVSAVYSLQATYNSFRREVLCNILIEFCIPMKMVWLIKMCLNASNSRVRVDKYLSVIFRIKNGLKQGDALSPILLNFALETSIRKDQVKHDYLKLNGTHKLLFYADVVNILGRSIGAMKKNTEALLVGSKENGLEVNADDTKYMVMFLDQNGRGIHNIKTDNNSFERVEKFKYFGTNLTNQSSLQEEIKSRLKSGNDCYHSAQNPLSSSLISKNVKIKINRSIIFPTLLCRCQTWSLTLREERRLRVFEKRVLRTIFGPKRDKVTGE